MMIVQLQRDSKKPYKKACYRVEEMVEPQQREESILVSSWKDSPINEEVESISDPDSPIEEAKARPKPESIQMVEINKRKQKIASHQSKPKPLLNSTSSITVAQPENLGKWYEPGKNAPPPTMFAMSESKNKPILPAIEEDKRVGYKWDSAIISGIGICQAFCKTKTDVCRSFIDMCNKSGIVESGKGYYLLYKSRRMSRFFQRLCVSPEEMQALLYSHIIEITQRYISIRINYCQYDTK
eukprot:TRINITY_DN7523_c0_g1_i1.p2 TRINITY_DN7523_c0_g1~~TRINITY_DN7523_c0_g1_i1.p2  ORF type:complete len:240 (-),score=20.68 TRINITY_DN7523_c0_g1_i1:931-1650(-)